ncbi:C-_U-editing enzyme APOBEC-2a [Aplochiton taeniatus]
MADKKPVTAGGRLTARRKERKELELKETEKEKASGAGEKAVANGAAPAPEDGDPANGAMANGAEANGTEANGTGPDGENQVEAMELPPFEIITGDRIDPFFFKFQFKNVEYSSGRNKTFLCYLVVQGNSVDGLQRGYLEDEHSGSHAEEAFFLQTLPHNDPALSYTITWYVSSSPCAACAAKLVEALKARSNVKMNIFASRLFEWEEPEIQEGLRSLAAAGCKLRVMKPLDFNYVWDTFVDNEDLPFTPWEDCKENYEYYQEKLADLLQ